MDSILMIKPIFLELKTGENVQKLKHCFLQKTS